MTGIDNVMNLGELLAQLEAWIDDDVPKATSIAGATARLTVGVTNEPVAVGCGGRQPAPHRLPHLELCQMRAAGQQAVAGRDRDLQSLPGP